MIAKFGPDAPTASWKRKKYKRQRKAAFARRKSTATRYTKAKRSKKSSKLHEPDPQHMQEIEQHQKSIDQDWETSRCNDQKRIGMFPELPSQQRVRDSLADFRTRISTPHLSQLCCGACGELWNANLIRKFTVGDSFLCEKNMSTIKTLLKAAHSPSTFTEGPFAGMALCNKGVDSDASAINICKRCYHSLNTSRRTPHLAVANNMDFGMVPPELLDLNWAEERVISLFRISIHVLNLRGHESPSHRDDESILHQQMKVKGHSFCVSQDVPSVSRALPVHPDELPDVIQVRH